MRTLLLAALVLGGAAVGLACSSGGGAGPEPIDTDWRREMDLEQLLAIAEALGLDLVEDTASTKITHEAVVAALEEETGCGCFGATCGTGYCGHECGTCDGAGEACFAGACETQGSCPTTALALGAQTAVLRNDTETLKFRYEAALTGGELQKLRIFSNTPVATPLGPGTYDLRQRDLAECNPCLAAYSLCTEESCGRAWVARAGVVEIEAIEPGGAFRGKVTNAKLEAAYEDPKTGVFTILEQFGAACVEEVAFEASVEEIVVEPSDCDPQGNGITVGSKLRDFTLDNCYGEPVSFHATCGAPAVWLIAATGW